MVTLHVCLWADFLARMLIPLSFAEEVMTIDNDPDLERQFDECKYHAFIMRRARLCIQLPNIVAEDEEEISSD